MTVEMPDGIWLRNMIDLSLDFICAVPLNGKSKRIDPLDRGRDALLLNAKSMAKKIPSKITQSSAWIFFSKGLDKSIQILIIYITKHSFSFIHFRRVFRSTPVMDANFVMEMFHSGFRASLRKSTFIVFRGQPGQPVCKICTGFSIRMLDESLKNNSMTKLLVRR